jgi:hypothetical protein
MATADVERPRVSVIFTLLVYLDLNCYFVGFPRCFSLSVTGRIIWYDVSAKKCKG